MKLADLRRGETIVVNAGGRLVKRIVVRVVDANGAMGGIVDTRPVGGRYSRSSGFVLGTEIVEPVLDLDLSPWSGLR